MPPGTLIPNEQFWAGNPAVFQRLVDPTEVLATEKESFVGYDLSQVSNEEKEVEEGRM